MIRILLLLFVWTKTPAEGIAFVFFDDFSLLNEGLQESEKSKISASFALI